MSGEPSSFCVGADQDSAADDVDPVAAALREAQEEVGLASSQSSPLGYLDPFVTITGFHVYPVVATVGVLLFGESLSPLRIAGLLAIMIGTILLSLSGKGH